MAKAKRNARVEGLSERGYARGTAETRARYQDEIIEGVAVVRETDKGLNVIADGRTFWVPKSQLRDGTSVRQVGDRGRLVVARWLVEEWKDSTATSWQGLDPTIAEMDDAEERGGVVTMAIKALDEFHRQVSYGTSDGFLACRHGKQLGRLACMIAWFQHPLTLCLGRLRAFTRLDEDGNGCVYSVRLGQALEHTCWANVFDGVPEQAEQAVRSRSWVVAAVAVGQLIPSVASKLLLNAPDRVKLSPPRAQRVVRVDEAAGSDIDALASARWGIRRRNA